MKCNLLIVGAGIYGVVVKEIAQSTENFDKIDFIDDNNKISADGAAVVGSFGDMAALSDRYEKVVVAIGDPDVRLSMLEKIKNETKLEIVTLVSPLAYVSPNAEVDKGCVIEPMAVVHAKSTLRKGCFVSAGAVVNHAAVCGEGVHVDCNATVEGYASVPPKTKIYSGTLFGKLDNV